MNPKIPDSFTDQDLAEICTKLGCAEPLSIEKLRVSLENLILFNAKQADYGPRNISGFGFMGVLVRMSDKMERLKNLFGSGKRRKPKNESIQDNLRDIANYSEIAMMVEKGVWPK